MSKKNKVVYSNIQPNTKEAGIWVNTDDGNIKIEKDGKWIDDGGNGGSAEASSVEYLDMSGLDAANKDSKYSFFGMYSNSIKAKTNGYVAFIPSGMYSSITAALDTVILAVAIDFNLPTNAFGETLMTTKEYILSLPGDFGFTEEELDSIPRITKEQFYSLES